MISFSDERSWRGRPLRRYAFVKFFACRSCLCTMRRARVHFCMVNAVSGIWKMDEPVGVGVWRRRDKQGNWISEKSEFDSDASKRRADHLDHFLKLPSFQQRYELEFKSRDSVRDARKCAGEKTRKRRMHPCVN